jgi:hypothetical protein
VPAFTQMIDTDATHLPNHNKMDLARFHVLILTSPPPLGFCCLLVLNSVTSHRSGYASLGRVCNLRKVRTIRGCLEGLTDDDDVFYLFFHEQK